MDMMGMRGSGGLRVENVHELVNGCRLSMSLVVLC